MSEHLSDHLRQVPIFAGLAEAELAAVEGFLSLRTITAGDFVFREGEKGDHVCFVADGQLEVIKFNHIGQTVVIARLARGDSIGEMSLIDQLTRSASVRARSASHLVVLTRDAFARLLEEHPGIGIKILKGIAHLLSANLRKTSDKLAEFMPPLA